MNDTEHLEENTLQDVLQKLWITGLALTVACVLLQAALITYYRSLRKFDEIILCELSAARTLTVVCEYWVRYDIGSCGTVLQSVMICTCFHSDAVMVILMFVFTRNLYNKVVRVFSTISPKLVLISVVIWLAPFPFSIWAPILLFMDQKYFQTYYDVYAHLKFVVLVLNMLMLIMIIRVAVRKRLERDRSVTKYLKTMVIIIILVVVMSLQVFVTDLLAVWYELIQSDTLVVSSGVVNSYQVVIIMVYFILMVKNKFNSDRGNLRMTELSTVYV